MKTVAAGFNQENLRLKLYSTTRGTCPGAAARGGDVLPPQAGRVPGPGLPVRAGPRGQVRGEDGEVGRVEAPHCPVSPELHCSLGTDHNLSPLYSGRASLHSGGDSVSTNMGTLISAINQNIRI